MLGEASTTEIAKSKDAQGFNENMNATRKGGGIAGGARQKLEYESGRKVVSSENYLEITGKVHKIKKLEDKKSEKKTGK